MCLIIDKKIKAKKPNKDGFCIGWKLLQDNTVSPYRGYRYKKGMNVATLGHEPDPNEEIHYGFHLWTTRSSARVSLKDWNIISNTNTNFKIIKVYYKPEDVIAYGKYSQPNHFKENSPAEWFRCVAVKRLTVRSLEGIK